MKKVHTIPHFRLTGEIPEFPDYTPSPEAFKILNKYCKLDIKIEELRKNNFTGEAEFLEESDIEDLFLAHDFWKGSVFYPMSRDEYEILRKESRSLVEYYCQLCDEYDYLTNYDDLVFTKEHVFFILSILQWGKDSFVLDRVAANMLIQLYKTDCSWTTIYPDEYDTNKSSQLFKEQLHILPPKIIYNSKIYDDLWSDDYGIFDLIFTKIPTWDNYSYISSDEVGHWMSHTIDCHLRDKGILVCLLPTNFLLQQDGHPSSGLYRLVKKKSIRMIVDLPRVTKEDYNIQFTDYSLVFLSKEDNDEIFMVDGKCLFSKIEHSFFDYCLDWKRLVKVIADKNESYVTVISHNQLLDYVSLSPTFYVNQSRFLASIQPELQYCRRLSKFANVNNINYRIPQHSKAKTVITSNQLGADSTCEIQSSNGEKGFPYAKIEDTCYLVSFHRQIFTSGYYNKENSQKQLYIDKSVCAIVFKTSAYTRDEDQEVIREDVDHIVEDFLIGTQGWNLPYELTKDWGENPYITIDSDIFFNGPIEYRREIVTKILDCLFDAMPDDNDVDEYIRLLEKSVDDSSSLEKLKIFVDSTNKKHRYFNTINRSFYNIKHNELESMLFSYLIHDNPQLFSQIMMNDFVYKQLFIMGSEWKLLLDKLYIPVCHFEKFISRSINDISKIRIQRNTGRMKLNSSKGFYNIIVETIDKEPVILDLGWAGKILFIAALIKNMQAINLSKYNKDKNYDLELLEEVSYLLYPKEKAIDISVLFDPVSRTKRVSDANRIIEQKLGKNNPCCIHIKTYTSDFSFDEISATTMRTTYAVINFPRYKCIFPPEFNSVIDDNSISFNKK